MFKRFTIVNHQVEQTRTSWKNFCFPFSFYFIYLKCLFLYFKRLINVSQTVITIFMVQKRSEMLCISKKWTTVIQNVISEFRNAHVSTCWPNLLRQICCILVCPSFWASCSIFCTSSRRPYFTASRYADFNCRHLM
jgi:hypothetical protein